LKLLLQAEHFLIKLTEARISPHVDIELAVNMLTFVTLWKVKKLPEARLYIERSAKLINFVIAGRRPSNISRVSAKNLYGIIVMGLSALKCVMEKDSLSAITLCKDAVSQLDGKNVLSRPLLIDLINHLASNSASELSLRDSPQVEFRPGTFEMFDGSSAEELPNLKLRNAGDWLISDLYEKVLFITTFVPLISSVTPWIDTAELEQARLRATGTVSEGVDRRMARQPTSRLKGKNRRTESTPRPRREMIVNSVNMRKFSQGNKEDDRSITARGEIRHFMFEFSAAKDKGNSSTIPIELIPIQPNNTVLPKLHKTVVNFRSIS
jgi:hypothetical protein